MQALLQDLRYTLRTLAKSPVFSAVAVATLALGIGASATIFSVVDAVLIRPLPYKDPSRLTTVFMTRSAARDRIPLSVADFLDWKEQNRTFERIAAYGDNRFNLTGSGRPEQIWGVTATAEFFTTLGVEPDVGRGFRPDEDRPGSEPVVVLSHGLWRTRFGSDPQVIGRAIPLNGRSHTVIGIMPARFHFPSRNVELWTNFTLDPPSRRGPYFLLGIARLRPNVSLGQASEEMASLARRLEQSHPRSNRRAGFRVLPMHESLTGEVRPALLVLLTAVALVLLIACVNVTNLVLARAAARETEFAIRTAVGAGRTRILRQSLTESVCLALIGGLGGLILASWGLDLVRAFGPQNIPRLPEIGIDGRILAFTLLIAAASGILFGLVAARHGMAASLSDALKEGRNTTAGAARGRLRNVLVAGEVSLALVLLIATGLMIKSFVRLQQVRTGIDPTDTLALQIMLPEARYPEDVQVRVFFQELLRRVEAVPGVERAGLGMSLPPDLLEVSDIFTIESGSRTEPPAPKVHAPLVFVSPGYFRALGIRLRKGRFFNDADGPGAPLVVIVNETLAERYFPGGDAVGKRMRVGGDERPDNPWLTVVGVVGDVPYNGLSAPPLPAFYEPLLQNPWRSMYLVTRSRAHPSALFPALRRAVWSLDPDLPVTSERTMKQILFDSVAQPRFRTVLLALFGGTGLLLASLGIYGVLSYSVSRRTREIGIRLALGAERSDVMRMVVGQGMTLALFGMATGLVAAVGLAQAMSALLFGVQPRDLLVFATVPLLLGGVAFLACLIPARRATRIDPMEALRSE